MQLDSDFLFNLALGNTCVIIDGTKHKTRLSKALRVGIPVIKYVLNRIWFGRTVKSPPIDDALLDSIYMRLSRKVRVKLKYFRKFLCTCELKIEARTFHTVHDGDYGYFKKIAKQQL